MAQFICPDCGAEYFVTAKVGRRAIFQVKEERLVHIIQSATGDDGNADIDESKIFCGACSWHGSLKDLVTSEID
jgi:hypothetical protein